MTGLSRRRSRVHSCLSGRPNRRVRHHHAHGPPAGVQGSSEPEPPPCARGPVLAPARASAGDRSWGQVGGFSVSLRALRGRGAAGNEKDVVAGKTRSQALFLWLPPAARNLHGKEGVDGSSPSEGFEFSLLRADGLVVFAEVGRQRNRQCSQGGSSGGRPSRSTLLRHQRVRLAAGGDGLGGIDGSGP
jgi:hypothetical protein